MSSIYQPPGGADRHAQIKLLAQALHQLNQAEGAWLRDTTPHTEIGRVKVFTWLNGICPIRWPNRSPDGRSFTFGAVRIYDAIFNYSTASYCDTAARKLWTICKHKSRRILHILNRIRITTAWCLARADGRARHAATIAQQQAKALNALLDEMALQALSSQGKSGV